jgi:hypothetical protein
MESLAHERRRAMLTKQDVIEDFAEFLRDYAGEVGVEEMSPEIVWALWFTYSDAADVDPKLLGDDDLPAIMAAYTRGPE